MSMAATISTIVIDAHNPELLAGFWCEVLGWTQIGTEDDGSIEIGIADQPGVSILFEPVTESKTVKNRVHLDVRPRGIDQADELERLVTLGARPADVGQGEQTWYVLADPEGNEFCLLRTRSDQPAVTAPVW